MGSPPTPDPSLAAELLIDAICERYEAALRAGGRPPPTEYLGDAPETLHTRLAEELRKVRAAHDSCGTLPFHPAAEAVEAETQVGPYTLVKPLGEGGMGEVWVARQERPVRRTVAVKLIKPGLDSRAVLARFEQERQALAHLDHPNVARVLDAGTTAHGRPYFVMELIDGQRLTAYCDTERLDVPARLRLFLDLGRAVQHAHQKGVIHRDLKPGNVLVARFDGRPVVKVIDFGVAKVLGERLTEESIATQAGSVVGTWEYMAPEQAGGAASDVDTRADVYSLGVILYELLTGLRPFDSRRLRQAPLDQAVRILREEDPPRPSTRLSQATAEDGRPADAKARTTLIRGDLDWVVMKCLEKDRGRRYESAAALGRDVERFLANEPVEARPPSRGYRLRKFVYRNRIAVGAGSVVTVAVLGGLAAAVLGYVQAKASEAETKQALAEVTFANDTIFDVFTDFDVRRVQQGADPVEYVLAERLVAASRQLTPEAIRDPVTRVRLQNRMGLTLLSLDRPRDAIPLFESALATQADHPDALETTTNLAEAFRKAGRSTEALALYEQVHAKTLDCFGADHVKSPTAVSNLAAGHMAVGQPQTARPLYEQALAWRAANLGESEPDALASLNNLAACYVAIGERLKAVPFYERALDLRTAKLGANHADTLLSLNNLASTYGLIGRADDALPLLEQAVTRHKAKFGPDHQQTLACMGNLASGYRRKGRLPEAVALYDETLRLQQARLGRTHPDTLLCMNNLAFTHLDANALDPAIRLFEETLALQKGKLGGDHPDTLLCANNLASAYHSAGALDRAIPLFEQTLAAQRVRHGADHPETMACTGNLAVAYAEGGRGTLAAPLFAEFVELKRKKAANELAFAATLTQVGSYLLAAHQFSTAEPHLRESLALREKLAPDKWGTFNARSLLGRSLLGQRKYGEAEPLLAAGYEGLLQRRTAIPRSATNSVFSAGQWLVELYETTRRPEKAREIRAVQPHEVAPPPRAAR